MRNLFTKSLDKFTKPLFKKRGFAENKIIIDWNKIVGEELDKYSSPRKLSFRKEKTTDAVLHVEVYDSSIATELMYLEAVIIEKISCYFGYKAVSKIKLIQKPITQNNINSSNIQTSELSEKNKKKLKNSLNEVDDEELKKALQSLGSGVLSTKNSSGRK